MFKLFEFKDEKGNIVAEVPVIVHDGEKLREIFDLYLPSILPVLPSIVVQTIMGAADTARGTGPHQLPDGAKNFYGFVLDISTNDDEEEDTNNEQSSSPPTIEFGDDRLN